LAANRARDEPVPHWLGLPAAGIATTPRGGAVVARSMRRGHHDVAGRTVTPLHAAEVDERVEHPEGTRGGGKKEAERNAAATTPHLRFAMVTHAGPGQTFWDIERKGGEAAAARRNVTLRYSSDPDSGKQATLIQSADPERARRQGGRGRGHPARRARDRAGGEEGHRRRPSPPASRWWPSTPGSATPRATGRWPTSAPTRAWPVRPPAGRSVLTAPGTCCRHVRCVLHAQGQIQLEARCNGVDTAFNGQSTKVYVNGTDLPAVRTTIAAKLKQDPSIDFVVLLDAPVALTAIGAVSDAGSTARIGTFDFNPQIPARIKDGQLVFAIDQQPWLQGYEAIDALWLYRANGNVPTCWVAASRP
jgi:simple sugar transport system substrate-binding protein